MACLRRGKDSQDGSLELLPVMALHISDDRTLAAFCDLQVYRHTSLLGSCPQVLGPKVWILACVSRLLAQPGLVLWSGRSAGIRFCDCAACHGSMLVILIWPAQGQDADLAARRRLYSCSCNGTCCIVGANLGDCAYAGCHGSQLH